MNKMLKIAALLVAFTTVAAFSQDGGMKFGVRGGFNMYKFSTGVDAMDDELSMGMGFGAGGVANIPLSGMLKVQAEAAFYYRELYSLDMAGIPGMGFEVSASEFAITVPVMVQVYPMENLWIGAGVQLDLPLSSTMDVELMGIDMGSTDIKDRSAIDFGIPIGLGYKISPEMAVDFRFVLGLTGTGATYAGDGADIKDESSYMTFGLGFTYFL